MSTFWSGKRVTVTGGHGFLGQHVVSALQHYDAQVFLPHGDLRETINIRQMYSTGRPEIVIHLAASVGGLGANIKNPGSFFYDNVKMGIELLEIGRIFGLNKFVQMGSACEYPKDAPLPLKEGSVWEGYPEDTNASYGISKRSLLTMGQAYRQQYGMNVIHLISTNLYGPGDNFGDNSHFIPAMIKRCARAIDHREEIKMWGTGLATRDFLYARDAAEGILLAAEHYDDAAPVNLGSGQEISIQRAALVIADLMGYNGSILWDSTMPDGQPRRVLDTSKAALFGFQATTPFEVGLSRTIKWYNERLR